MLSKKLLKDGDRRENLAVIGKATLQIGLEYVSGLRFVSPILDVFFQRFVERRVKLVEDFFTDLDKRLQHVERRLDDDSFFFLIEKALPIIATDSREFKRRILTNALIAAAKDRSEHLSLHRILIDLVDVLEPHHVAILWRLSCPNESEIDKNGKTRISFSELQGVIEISDDSGGKMRDALTLEAVTTLSNKGLLSSGPGKSNEGKPMIGTNSVGLWLASSYGLTGLGLRFLEMLRTQ